MFAGHFAVGFAAKKVVPKINLGWLITASLLSDVLSVVFIHLGVEQIRTEPVTRQASEMNLKNIPWSHSLMLSIAWALLAGVIWWLWRNHLREAIIVSSVVMSHWLLDFLTHTPDLALWPGSTKYLGLGLYRSTITTAIAEGILLVVALIYYARITSSHDRIGSWGFRAYAFVLVLIYLYTVLLSLTSGRLQSMGFTIQNANNDAEIQLPKPASESYANTTARQVILPEVNWALAATGGTWVSEVHVIDVTGGSTVQAYYNSGTTRRGPFTLWTNAGGAGSSTSFSNILETLSGLDAGFTYYGTSGALELETQDASHKLQASSRTYNGNYSRTFPALVDTDTNTAASGRTLIISNISYNGSYRPSVVLYNPSADSVTAGVTVLGANGSTVVTTSRTLAGHEMRVITSELRVGSYRNAKVQVEVTAGLGRVMTMGLMANFQKSPTSRSIRAASLRNSFLLLSLLLWPAWFDRHRKKAQNTYFNIL